MSYSGYVRASLRGAGEANAELWSQSTQRLTNPTTGTK